MANRRYSELKTTNGQRIFIWIVLAASVIGVVATSVFMIMQTSNKQLDPATIAQQQQQDQYNQQVQQQAQAQAERQKTLRPLDGFAKEVGTFDAKSITSLEVSTLKAGDGAILKDSDTIAADYTGWTPDGKIFDSTTQDAGNGKTTNTSATFALNQVITGWTKGLTGQKVGGTYLLAIPADQAYGSQGTNGIAPNTPLKFIVHVASVQ